MFSTFLMGPAASGRGLCDIDSLEYEVTQSRIKQLGLPGLPDEITVIITYNLYVNWKPLNYRYIFV